MTMLVWGVAGGLIGWIALKYFGANKLRGATVSMTIGMLGGLVGGGLLMPLMRESPPMQDAFDLFALVYALAGAAVFLTVGDMLSKRFGV